MPRPERIVVTCDSVCIPPLNGHTRKTHDMLMAIASEWEVEAAVYPGSPEEWERAVAYWEPQNVRLLRLSRRDRCAKLRSFVQNLSLPTVTRDFAAEAALIRERVAEGRDVRVIVDFVSGFPLMRFFSSPRGFLLSGHDCMSYLFAEEARYAANWRKRLHNLLRRRFALNAERRYAHRGEAVHVVSTQDAQKLAEVNPRAKFSVIPIAGTAPDATKLLPFAERTERVIWGYLGSNLVLEGVRQLFTVASHMAPAPLKEWKMVGGLPKSRVLKLLPEIERLGIEYIARVDDLSAFLGRTRTVLLPDVSGTGQKNRTMDSLSHGCSVLGLSEVFRDIEERDAFFVAKDYADLLLLAGRESELGTPEVSENAKRVFQKNFSHKLSSARWLDLVGSLGCVEVFSPSEN